MKKVLKFKVGIKELEDKIWRIVEISESDTLADLCYFVIASFELYGNVYFAITCNDKKYDSVKPIFNHGDIESALNVLLKDLTFVDDSKMVLTYDYQNKIEFVLEFLGYGSTNGDVQYPNICDGAGKGAIDGVRGEELKSIVDETDRLGYSSYHNTIIDVDGSEIEEEFDYRDFDLDIINMIVGSTISCMKEDYEYVTLIDVLRIMRDRMAIFYKTDIKNIVRPYDYIKEYLPDNYGKLSFEEKKSIHIPSYEELNIYRLPDYQELNHKKIMTLYVKNNVKEKGIRQPLFYALRNHEYMDKFYDCLREYGLFNDYLFYSEDYYKEKLREWQINNDIKEL